MRQEFHKQLGSIRTVYPPNRLNLQGVKKVVYHYPCPDGIASAMIIGEVLDVPLVGLQYGTPEQRDLPIEPGLLFVDISPPEIRWQDFLDAGSIVLDHHKGVKNIVEAFARQGQGAFADETEHPGISGAVLAYSHVYEPLVEIPNPLVAELARLAGIRDTWLTDHPDWVDACKQSEALKWWPEGDLLGSGSLNWQSMLRIGDVLWRKRQEMVKKVAEERTHFFRTNAGTSVAFFAGSRQTSDVAEYLKDRAELIIGYDIGIEEGRYKFILSCRSKGQFDCKLFCQAHGGGGHTKAAGCGVFYDVLDAPNPYVAIEQTLNSYEA